MRKLSLLLALALAACGGSSSSTKSPKVALFIDPEYVDYGDVEEPEGSEASNMEAALAAMAGVTVETCTASDIETVLVGKNVFVLPEQENGPVAPDLGEGGRDRIYDFVHNKGGELIMASPRDAALGAINDTFAYSLASVDSGEPAVRAAVADAISITPAATGTVFDGGAATLPRLSATTLVDLATLPAGAKVIYADAAGHAAVVVIPNGSGNIILLGWDWYDAVPVGVEDGGWNTVFEAAVNY